MKRLVLGVALLLFFVMPANAGALETTSGESPLVDGPLLITKYSFQGDQVRFVELYNETNMLVSLDGWSLYVVVSGIETELTNLGGYIKPQSWVTVGNKVVFTSTPTFSFAYTDAPSSIAPTPTKFILRPPASTYLDQTATVSINNSTGSSRTLRDETTVPATFGFQRNSSSSSGSYTTTFSAILPDGNFRPFDDGLYEPQIIPNIRPVVSELLPNPRACAPNDTAPDCVDYVKLYNPSNLAIDLSLFRLRNGYFGQTSSSTNTTPLTGMLEPGHYVIVATTVTNSGGWIWLEDTYGFERFDETIIEYPDASADSKKGQAWAYSEADDTWKWTTHPTPLDEPSVFPPPPIIIKTVSTLVPCREDQYRSEETNRCRSIVNSALLTTCREGQYRSAETNRCRSVLSAVAELVPCRQGQERSPTTNRCRNIVLTDIPKAAFAIQPVTQTGMAFIGWWALGGVGVLAMGYAGWEWRYEVMIAMRKVSSFFTSSK